MADIPTFGLSDEDYLNTLAAMDMHLAAPSISGGMVPDVAPNAVGMPITPLAGGVEDGDPDEIQMPAEDARPQVNLGMPHDPGPGIEQDAGLAPMSVAEQLGGAAAGGGLPPAPPELALGGALHPGLGVPQSAIDAAMMQAPPAVDAISGGDWRANVPAAAGGNEYQLPSPGADPLTADEAARQFASQSPLEQAKQIEADQFARSAEQSRREGEAALVDQQHAIELHHGMQQAFADAKAERQKLEQEIKQIPELDQGNWWATRSTGQTIAAFLSAIAGGLVQHLNGGRNIGLEAINRAIDQDLEVQKANIAGKRQGISDRMKLSQANLEESRQSFLDDETYRIASLERVKGDIKREMGSWRPESSRAINLGRMYSMIDADQQKRLAAREKESFDIKYKAIKDAADLRKTAAETEKLLAEGAKLRGAIGGAGGAKSTDPQDVIHDPEDFVALQLGPRPPARMSFNGYNNWLKTRKLASETTSGDATMSKEDIEHAVPGVLTVDGKPYLANGPPDNAVNLSKRVAATKSLVRLMDEALALRTGWTSDIAKSDEWRQLKTNWAAATGVAKDVLGLGALSGPDMELVDRFIGTADPTEFRNPEAGILKARENVINMTRDALGQSSLRGKVNFDIPYIKPTPPKATADDKAQKAALHNTTGAEVLDAATVDRQQPIVEKARDLVEGRAPVQAPSVEEAATKNERDAIQHIDRLDQVLTAGSADEQKEARALLDELVQKAPSGVANHARDILLRHTIGAQSIDPSGPVRSVSYEEAPPRPATAPNKKKGGR